MDPSLRYLLLGGGNKFTFEHFRVEGLGISTRASSKRGTLQDPGNVEGVLPAS